jgi:hypothetical protein
VRRVPHTRTRQATRARWLPGRLLAAALIVGAVALLAPGVSYATASLSSPSSPSSPAAVGCTGVTPAAFPALGFITNASRTQGGHLWWRRSAAGTSVCIGTVVEWVQYNATAAKTWRVIIYSAQHLGRGWYFWSFGVHQAYSGLSAVCITADDSFGVPCIHFGQS